MKFVKLEISNFKCFPEYTWELSDKLNIVFGPNESGKTTLYQALILSLFGYKSGRSKNFRDLEREDFLPLGSNIKPNLYLNFSANGLYYFIRRDFNESKVEISQNENPDRHSFEKYQINDAKKFISDQLGGVEEEIFTKYASINHTDLAGLNATEYKKENNEMRDSLTKLVERQFGEGLLEVGKRIKNELKDLKISTKQQESEFDNLKTKLSEMQLLESEIESLRKANYVDKENLKICQNEFNQLDTVLSKYRENIELQKKNNSLIKNLEEYEKEYIRCEKVLSYKKDVQNKFDSYPSTVRDNVDNVRIQLDDIKSKNQEIQTLLNSKENGENTKIQDLANAEKDFDIKYKAIFDNQDDVLKFKENDNQLKSIELAISEKYRKKSDLRIIHDSQVSTAKRRKIGSIIALILGLIISMILYLIVKSDFLSLPFAAVTIVVSIVFYLNSRKVVDPDLIEKIDFENKQINDLEKQHAELKSFISQISEIIGLKSSAEFDKFYDDYRQAEFLIKTLRKQIQEIQFDRKNLSEQLEKTKLEERELVNNFGKNSSIELSDLIARISDTQKELKNIESRITNEKIEDLFDESKKRLMNIRFDIHAVEKELKDKFPGDPVSVDEYIAKEARHSKLKDEISDLEIRINETSVRIDERKKRISAGGEMLDEKLDRMKMIQNSYNQQKEELEYLSEIVDGLITEYQTEFRPRLEKRSLELFNTFAGTSDKKFSLQNWPSIIISSTQLDGFEERHLSQGTRDQLYFALRIAWSDILTPENIKLPLLWDDPFVYWDEERTAGAIEVTRKLLELGHQIILFTHREELLEMFKNKISSNSINLLNLDKSKN